MNGRNVLAWLAVLLVAVPAFVQFSGAIYFGPRVKIDIGDSTLDERAATVVTVTVYNETGVPVPGVTVRIEAELGSFDRDSATTSGNGRASFIYTAPDFVPEPRPVNITATAVYDIPPYTSDTESVWVSPVPRVSIDGPDQVVTGSDVVRYVARVMTGIAPVSGALMNVSPPSLGTIVQNQQSTDETGRAWIDYRPPASGTGETVLTVSATPPMMVLPVVGSKTIQVVTEILTMTVSVATDRDPVPCWGSSNLTAVVRMGNQAVPNATVQWIITRGWWSGSSTVTDPAGRTRIQYTAANSSGSLWAGTVTVTVRATFGSDRAEANTSFEVSPYAVAWTADLVYSSSGGQLFSGEKLTVNLSLRMPNGRFYDFITPVSVDLRMWSGTGTLLYNRTLVRGLSVVSGLEWSSGPVDIYTVPASPAFFQARWQVRVLSDDWGYVYHELPEPVQVYFLSADVPDWTFLMYVCNDNDLYNYANYYLNGLEKQFPDGRFRCLVQKGGVNFATCRYELRRDLDDTNVNMTLLDNIGEQDQGSPETILDFLVWGCHEAPAKNYAIIIYDHGGAYEGSCWDYDTYPHSNIGIDEMESALRRFSAHARKPEILVFDACLMSSLESLDRLRDCVRYVCGCEVLMYTDSLFVTPAGLRRMGERFAGGHPTAEQLLRDLIDGFEEGPHRMYPYAITAMGPAAQFFDAFDTLCIELLEKWPALGPLVLQADDEAVAVCGVNNGAIRTLLDLKTMLEGLRSLIEGLPNGYRYAEAILDIQDTLQKFANAFFWRNPDTAEQGSRLGAMNLFFPSTSSYYNYVRDGYTGACSAGLVWPGVLDALYYQAPGGGALQPHPNVAGINLSTLRPRLQESDSNSDGIVESATGQIQIDENPNVSDINIFIDTVIINGTMAESGARWAGRQVISVPAKTKLDRTFEISSPVEDPVNVIVTVVAPDGTILQQFDLGTFRMVPIARPGNPPVLDISASAMQIPEGRQVNFTATATDADGDKVTIWWDVDAGNGIGQDATGLSAAAAYRGAGNRTVTCIASDGTHVAVRQLEIRVEENPNNRKPVANLTFRFSDDATVVLNASGSSDPDGDALEYRFLFGDGAASPWAVSPVASHAYANGTYECVVMVRDACRYYGSAALVTLNVTGQAPPPANRAPAARFVVISNLMGAKKPIGFDASVSSDPDNDTLQYRFDWGDGNTTGWTASDTASHTYAMPGTYNVTLTVRDAGDLSDAITTAIIVKPAPGTIATKGFIPGPGLAAAAIAMALAAAFNRKRKR